MYGYIYTGVGLFTNETSVSSYEIRVQLIRPTSGLNEPRRGGEVRIGGKRRVAFAEERGVETVMRIDVS